MKKVGKLLRMIPDICMPLNTHMFPNISYPQHIKHIHTHIHAPHTLKKKKLKTQHVKEGSLYFTRVHVPDKRVPLYFRVQEVGEKKKEKLFLKFMNTKEC